MVAYNILLFLVVGGLFWFLFRLFIKMWPKKSRTQTVEEKRVELDNLRSIKNDLGQEVAITKELVDVDSQIELLEGQLDQAENKRTL